MKCTILDVTFDTRDGKLELRNSRFKIQITEHQFAGIIQISNNKAKSYQIRTV